MKKIKLILVWFVLGLLVGIWFGYNIGRGQPFYSNPFEAQTLKEKISEAGEGALEKSGEALEKAGKAMQKNLKK